MFYYAGSNIVVSKSYFHVKNSPNFLVAKLENFPQLISNVSLWPYTKYLMDMFSHFWIR